ncbi:serine--tRNA ligase [Paenibacillus bouchesdurhonensis]|uniref:serine--tRNA ligase n=1 Tax=Paenibacillus bouchesdurhonensis TaxID=1870990 RepID=UPI000DA5F364|nr:serine--tRNA ligase [Paenibacillus bouchesdurhonensis]
MLDVKWIRAHAEEVQRAADHKRINFSVRELLEWDDRRKRHLLECEELRRQRNEGAEQAQGMLAADREAEAAELRAALKGVNRALKESAKRLEEAVQTVDRLTLLAPNVVSEDTPIGSSEEDNVEIRRVGHIPEWSFVPRDHVELGRLHDMLDIPRGVKAGGSRTYYLKGTGALLHRAVQQLAFDLLIERGFVPMEVPLLLKEQPFVHSGYFPAGQDQSFYVEDERKWLAGTSEVPLLSYYEGELLDLSEPLKLVSASNCFRSEVGSAGRDVKGLYRVHQFAKVEMVVLCQPDPDLSEKMLQEITSHAEELLALLELPYRVMSVCTGDMSGRTYKQYDIETWMPSTGSYGETHSSSNLHSFQSRRANIRCIGDGGAALHCHTLNNTAVASPRILIPLLENHQDEDGSIYIPKALRKYVAGRERFDIL